MSRGHPLWQADARCRHRVQRQDAPGVALSEAAAEQRWIGLCTAELMACTWHLHFILAPWQCGAICCCDPCVFMPDTRVLLECSAPDAELERRHGV
jgi:hypothetical protein